MKELYTLGIDFGSTTCRAMVVDVKNKKFYTGTHNYDCGKNGVIQDESNIHIARQSPKSYVESMRIAVKEAVKEAKKAGLDMTKISSIATATTGSTPIPVDNKLQPIAFQDKFKDNINAQAWMWKDHSSYKEAEKITETAKKYKPEYLKKCGGAYSSEWFFAKLFHCYNVDKAVFDSAYTWLEFSDFIPAQLAGITENSKLKRNLCAAGHKAMYNQAWGGLPEKSFLKKLDTEFAKLHDNLFSKAYSLEHEVGGLSKEWAAEFGLKEGTPVLVGLLDAHMGAIGAGVNENICVRIIGTSSCDIMIHPMEKPINDIIGVSGVADESVLPKFYGIEAGQSAVGDIFNWYISELLNKGNEYHAEMTKKSIDLKPGQTGLLALDWNNGNRNILTDANLSGLLVGQTLHTKDYEVYRALIEGTAFGARVIFDRIESYEIDIKEVINCGGIALKNPMFMQILADVLNKPMLVSANNETVALGSAIVAASYSATKNNENFSIKSLQDHLCAIDERVYQPIKENVEIYEKLYQLYKKLHDSFGIKETQIDLYEIMKKLIEYKN